METERRATPLIAPVKVVNDEPVPVSLATDEPVPVKIEGDFPSPSHIQDQSKNPSLPAKTTFQEDLTTASQRKINFIWEYTQSAVALFVVATGMLSGLISVYRADDKPVPTIISMAFGTIVGFYFSRTNHEKVGGIGFKPQSDYVGR